MSERTDGFEIGFTAVQGGIRADVRPVDESQDWAVNFLVFEDEAVTFISKFLAAYETLLKMRTVH
jgi:hypothetical protein